MVCRGCTERAKRAASPSLTGHWRCQCQHPSGCSAAVAPPGRGQWSASGGVPACVAAPKLGREAGRERGDSSPSLRDLDGARCCISTAAGFRASPPWCTQTSACGAEVSDLLQGCKETDEWNVKPAGIWGFGAPKSKY